MKQIIRTLLFCLVAGRALSQTAPKMDLRPSGFFGPDSIKRYVVIDAPKISKADLFKRTLTYVNSLYKNPQAVVTAVAGESIVINASTDVIKGKPENAYYPTKYSIQIEFKDGKIKFQPTIIEMKEQWTKLSGSESFYISNKDSKDPHELKAVWIVREDGPLLFNKEVKQSLDQWVNGYLAGIVAKVNDTW